MGSLCANCLSDTRNPTKAEVEIESKKAHSPVHRKTEASPSDDEDFGPVYMDQRSTKEETGTDW